MKHSRGGVTPAAFLCYSYSVSPFQIPVHEFEISYARSSGPGGQNVNKVNSKCVLRWNPTTSTVLKPEVLQRFLERFRSRLTTDGAILVTSDSYRDQKRNYDHCVEKINEMVFSVLHPPKKRTKTKPSRSSREKRLKTKKAHSDKKSMRGKSWD